jgi:hypothetical protein
MATLILKHASASRPSGEWSDDDYDVLTDGKMVGRIFKVHAPPVGTPWMWTLLFGYHEGPYTDARLGADARGRDGGIRQKLAAGSGVAWHGISFFCARMRAPAKCLHIAKIRP